MEPSINTYIWQQFGAALDMLENAIRACSPELWNEGSRFWYLSFHTIYWTDYYLSDQTPEESDFTPPAPFTKSDFEYDAMPERVYDKEELLVYLAYARQKLHDQLTRLIFPLPECGGHFWPYGLNYDNEWSDANAYQHVKMVWAMRASGM
jgi:hypothetical protein